MSNLCLSTYVYDNKTYYNRYSWFIPFYIYSVLKSYPDYYIKIFFRDKIDTRVKRCIELLKKELSHKIEIKENYYKQFWIPEHLLYKYGKFLRWLLPETEFKDFEYVYIGDIDFLIIREFPSLLNGHLEHCKSTQLPYSNIIRPTNDRLTGLHFIKRKDYFDRVNPYIKYYTKNAVNFYNIVEKYKGNEYFLYDLINKGIGFDGLNNMYYRPHHGFHLGCIKKDGIKKGYFVDSSKRHIDLPPYKLLRETLENYYSDSLFTKLRNMIKKYEIEYLYKYLTIKAK